MAQQTIIEDLRQMIRSCCRLEGCVFKESGICRIYDSEHRYGGVSCPDEKRCRALYDAQKNSMSPSCYEHNEENKFKSWLTMSLINLHEANRDITPSEAQSLREEFIELYLGYLEQERQKQLTEAAKPKPRYNTIEERAEFLSHQAPLEPQTLPAAEPKKPKTTIWGTIKSIFTTSS